MGRQGLRMKTTGIVRNAAVCLDCGDEIESTHRHDMRFCSCGKVAVDGGTAYLRRVFSSENARWEDRSICLHHPDQHPGERCYSCGAELADGAVLACGCVPPCEGHPDDW